MSFSSKDMEFDVSGARLKLEDGLVERCLLLTDKFETGHVFFKPRYESEEEVETEVGLPADQKTEEMYAPEELPEEILEVLKKAEELDSLTVTATVTKQEDEDETRYFINQWDIDSLESRLLQDKGGSQA
jgi:hypothetical protein